MPARSRAQPPPIPERVRMQLPEWGTAMRKVRRALKRGRTSEAAIGYEADLDAWTVRAALELMVLTGEVEMVQDARWRGLMSETLRYGSPEREQLREDPE